MARNTAIGRMNLKPSALEWYYKFANGITERTPKERYGYLTALYIENLIDYPTYKKELEAIKEKKDASSKSE